MSHILSGTQVYEALNNSHVEALFILQTMGNPLYNFEICQPLEQEL